MLLFYSTSHSVRSESAEHHISDAAGELDSWELKSKWRLPLQRLMCSLPRLPKCYEKLFIPIAGWKNRSFISVKLQMRLLFRLTSELGDWQCSQSYIFSFKSTLAAVLSFPVKYLV